MVYHFYLSNDDVATLVFEAGHILEIFKDLETEIINRSPSPVNLNLESDLLILCKWFEGKSLFFMVSQPAIAHQT